MNRRITPILACLLCFALCLAAGGSAGRETARAALAARVLQQQDVRAEAREALARLIVAHDAIGTELASTRALLATANADNERLEAEKAELNRTITTLTQQLAAASEEIARLRRLLEEQPDPPDPPTTQPEDPPTTQPEPQPDPPEDPPLPPAIRMEAFAGGQSLGAVIDGASLPAGVGLNIRLDGAAAYNVRLTGATTHGPRGENVAPHWVFGDNNGTPNAFRLNAGAHTLEIKWLDRAGGAVLGTLTYAIQAVAAQPPPQPDPQPDPPPQPDPDLPELHAMVGRPMHVRLPEQQLTPAAAQTKWLWDFGDPPSVNPQSRWNQLAGFNAAHEYTRAGSYTLKLNGAPWARVTVQADPRPVRQVADAADLAQRVTASNVILVLPPGDTVITGTLAPGQNVEICGHANGSRLLWGGALDPRNGRSMLRAAPGLTLRGFTQGVRGMGQQTGNVEKMGLALVHPLADSAIIDCVFENIDDVANGNQRPLRVYIAGNTARWDTSLRSYLVWGEGEQWVILGNTVTNSTGESVVRLSASGVATLPGTKLALVAGNRIDNLDRRPQGDPNDYSKGSAVAQHGLWVSLWKNELGGNGGVSGVGPLGGADGKRDYGLNAKWVGAWIGENFFRDSFTVEDGAEEIGIYHNIMIGRDRNDNGVAIKIVPPEREHGFTRVPKNVVIQGNTIGSAFEHAMLIWVQEPVAGGFLVRGNTFTYGTAAGGNSAHRPLYFSAGGLPGHYQLIDNIFPRKRYGWPNNAADVVAIVGSDQVAGSYRSLAQLNTGASSGNRLVE